METPIWKFDEILDGVYEPREDSFLLLDAIEADIKLIKEECCPTVALEIGSGSGIIISAIANVMKSSLLCIALDINPAACKVTSQTARLNSVSVEVLRSDLLSGIKLDKQVDLLLFNPPYVPSTEEEVTEWIDKAWAGSGGGRCLLDRLFQDLHRLMSKRCMGYLVAIEENNPKEIIRMIEDMGFNCLTVARRKIVGEKLSVIRFSKGIKI